MNVSKEVKEMLLDRIDYLRQDMALNKQHLDVFSKEIDTLAVTEPAPAKHEWKVGDCFHFESDLRCICENLGITEFFTLKPNHERAEDASYGSIDDLIKTYEGPAKATLDDWFAAVRRAHEGRK